MIKEFQVYSGAVLYYKGETTVTDTLVSRDYGSNFELINPIIHIIKEGERLVDIAYKYYNNHNLWFVIASFNRDKIINPIVLEPGVELRIPDPSLIPLL